MTEQQPVPTEIVGRRPPMTRKAIRFTVLLALLLVVLFVVQVARGRWTGLLLPALWTVVLLVQRLRPPTVVNASGIRRPWRRRSRISWVEVETVAEPLPGHHPVRLNLVGASPVSLDGIPAAQSAAVAALGEKQVTRAVPMRLPPPRPGHRTDADIEADVARRARALAEERAALEMRYPRLRRAAD